MTHYPSHMAFIVFESSHSCAIGNDMAFALLVDINLKKTRHLPTIAELRP